jgi:hypothetical protein
VATALDTNRAATQTVGYDSNVRPGFTSIGYNSNVVPGFTPTPGATQSYSPPPAAPPPNAYPGSSTNWGMSATPWLENAFGQYGSQYQQPTATSQFYGQAGAALGQPSATAGAYGQYSGYLSQPTATGSVFGAAGNALSGPTTSQNTYGALAGMLGQPTATSGVLDYAGSTLGGPSDSRQLYDTIGSQYLQPSASGQVYNGLAGSLSGPSATQQYYSQNGGAYGAPTAIGNLSASNPYGSPLVGEQLGAHAMDLYGNSTYSHDNLGNAMANANAPSELAQNASGIQGLYNGANYTQGFIGANGSQLSSPGALEQFAAQDLNHTNPYFDMLQKQQADTIDQAAAARGAYGAGGSMAAQALGSANLRAQQYQQEGQLQGSAQQAQLSRLGLGANVAGQASQERMSQGNALQGLYQNMFGDRMQGQQLGLSATGQADTANMQRLSGITNMAGLADQSTLARLGGQANLAGAASSSALDYLNSGLGAAGAADSTGLARAGMLGTLAGQSDTQRLAGLSGLSNLAGQSDQTTLGNIGMLGTLSGQQDTQSLNRFNSAMTGAGQVDQSIANNFSLLGNMAGNVDTQGLNRYSAAMSGANQVDSQNLARLGLQGQLAGQVDSTGLNWLNSYFGQAGNAQGAGQTRTDNELNQLFQSAALQAGLYGQFYGAGGQQSVEGWHRIGNCWHRRGCGCGQPDTAGQQERHRDPRIHIRRLLMAFQYIMPTPVDMSDVLAPLMHARQASKDRELKRAELLMRQQGADRENARLDEQIRHTRSLEERQQGMDVAQAIPKIKSMLTPGSADYDPESGMSMARAYGINLAAQQPQMPTAPEKRDIGPTQLEYGPRATHEISQQAAIMSARTPPDQPDRRADEVMDLAGQAEAERKRFEQANDPAMVAQNQQLQTQQDTEQNDYRAKLADASRRSPTYTGSSPIGPVSIDPNAAMASRAEALRQQQEKLSPLTGAVDDAFRPVVDAMVKAGMPGSEIAKAVADYRKQTATDSRDAQFRPTVGKQDEWHQMAYRAAMANAGARRAQAGDDDPRVGGAIAQYLTDNPGDITGAYAAAGQAGSRAPTKTVGAVVTQTKPTESQQKAAEQAAQGLRAVDAIDKLGYKPSEQEIQQWINNQRSVNRAEDMSKNSTFGSLVASGGQALGALKRSEFDGMSPEAAEYFTNVRRMMEPLARKQSGAAIADSEWRNFFNQYGPMSPGGAAAARRDLSDLARGGGAATRQLEAPKRKSNPIIDARHRPSLDDLAKEHGL